MNLTQLTDAVKLIKNDFLQMNEESVKHLFRYVTKSAQSIGVTMSVHKLTEKVFTAVDALLIEQTRDAISKSNRSLSELFTRHCSKQNGFLDYAELENMLLECQLALKPHMLDRLQHRLDVGKKQGRVSLASLRFLISGEASAHEPKHSLAVQRSYDYEPSLDKGAKVSEEAT